MLLKLNGCRCTIDNLYNKITHRQWLLSVTIQHRNVSYQQQQSQQPQDRRIRRRRCDPTLVDLRHAPNDFDIRSAVVYRDVIPSSHDNNNNNVIDVLTNDITQIMKRYVLV
jgi:hypothetical protein